MEGLQDPKPHIVLVPYIAQGHMIPMIDLAHLLAGRGVLVSLITTPMNASRVRRTIDRARDSGLPLQFVELPFPCAEVGLPDGCENVDVVPSPEALFSLYEATTLLAKPLEQYLRGLQPAPSCIINDLCQPWTRQIANNLGIPRFTFFSFSCFTLLCNENIWRHRVYTRITDQYELFEVPGMDERVEVTRAQAPGFFDLPGWEKPGEEVREAELTADGIVVNTFDDLELAYIQRYADVMGKKVWSLGPFSLHNDDVAAMAARGDTAAIDVNRCMQWLDTMEPGSVVYVSFGSLTHVSATQLMEIGSGLEAAGRPFVWVIKAVELTTEVAEWLAAGFEERTRAWGLVVKGWAPQAAVLAHGTVGGFVTHCGWNSCMEAVAAGVAVATWPHFADQFLNEKLVVDVARIGFRVGVEVPSVSKWEAEHEGSFVKREAVERAVRMVMDGGEEGMERRRRAKELANKASKAMEVGGSSYQNMTQFLQYISDCQIDLEGKNIS